MEKFLKIWKDPVWSKVISAGIIALIILIYNLVVSILKEINFFTSLKQVLTYKIEIWIVSILFFLYIIIQSFIKNVRQKNKNDSFYYDDRTLALDIELFNNIRINLLNLNSIYWISNHNFAGYSFDSDKLEPFENIEIESNKPDFEFFNPLLETSKDNLIENIRSLNSTLLTNIFSEGDSRLSVPPEWELEQPERFNKAVENIHAQCFNVKESYYNFIKIGRKVLKVK